MAYRISAELTFWFLVMVAILTIVIVGFSRLVNPLYSVLRKKTDQLVQETRQQLQGMRLFVLLAKKNESYRFFKPLTKSMQFTRKDRFLVQFINPLTYLIVNGTLLVIIWQGYISIQGGLLSQGALIALSTISYRFWWNWSS